MSFTIYESPIGPLTLIAGPDGLRALHFPGRGPSKREHDRLRPVGREAKGREPVQRAAARALAAAADQLDAYFAGELRGFDLALDIHGTAFQRRVWAALAEIPYGETTTYGTLARELGAARPEGGLQPPGALPAGWPQPRAVGAAVGRTPIPIVIGCHRVVGADGSLVGYGGGLHRKRALLDFEASGGQPAALHSGWKGPQLALL
jgi:methylated-DNA-[protein]-cysteine S-methyltransferase